MSLCSNVSHHDHGLGCFLSPATTGRFDTVAGLRIVSSLLGFFGASSVIISVILKRRVFNAEIHPIFMLSLSDCMLAVLWISGSSIWLGDPNGTNRVWCYAVTLMTIIMECVSINMTLVYALLAYLKVKKTDLNSFLAHSNQNDLSWKKTTLIYTVAWILPVFFVMMLFGITEGAVHFLQSANDCSCWCLPTLINVIPFVIPVNKETLNFIHFQGKLLIGLGVILILHYVLVFVALLVLYSKILYKIKKLRQEHDETIDSITKNNYGAAEATRLVLGQSQAKKRVTLFLTTFICSGFCNMMLAIVLVVFIAPHLHKVDDKHHSNHFYVYLSFLYAQSLTLPLQGFMNAIVYGWTRDDFVQTIALHSHSEMNSDFHHANLSAGTELEESCTESDYERFQETIPGNSDSD